MNDVTPWGVLPGGDPALPDRGLHGREARIHTLDL